jgi:IgA-specific serine endopeptidase
MTDTPEHDVLPPTTTQVAEFTQTAAALAELRQQLAGATFDCTTPAGDREARQSRRLLVELRTTLETKRQELKAPLLERGRLLDAEAKRITGEIVAMEQPIDAQIKAEEQRRAEIVAAAQRKELARQASNKAQIDAIRDAPLAYLKHPAADIQAEIDRLRALDLGQMDEDYRDQAHHTLQLTLGQLIGMHERAAEAEHAAAALAAERAENERIRLAAAERERQQRAAHEAELAEQRRQAQAEADARAAEQAERERVHREALQALERKQAEQEAREREERDKLAREQVERAEAERQQREQAEAEAARVEQARLEQQAAERERADAADWQDYLAKVTLREAAMHAHDQLAAEFGEDCNTCQELRAALGREPAGPLIDPALQVRNASTPRVRKSRAKAKPAVQP